MSRKFRFVLASLLATLPALSPAQGQEGRLARGPVSAPRPTTASLSALADSIVTTHLIAQGVPSASVVVMRGGETLVRRAWGVADVASGRAADPNTVYAIGSISKQFTAALLLKQVGRGRLSLGDPIGRHLTGLRPEWRTITIEQLLNHTSGLQRSFVDPARAAEYRSGDSLVAQAARDTMASRPGTAFLYSNTGYMLLGVLVEKLYGTSYGAALRDEIARPLGLPALGVCGEDGAGRAGGYNRAFDGSRTPGITVHMSQALGAGGICSTASDLAAWNRALHGGRVLSPASYAAMTTPRGAAAEAGYGFGLEVRPAPWGGPSITHGGQEVFGFTAENGWYPADSLSVTILYNAYPRVLGGGTTTLAALALGHTPPAASTPAPPPAVPATPATGITGEEAQRQFVGSYELGRGTVFTVSFEDGRFYVAPPRGDRQPLVHESGATYALGGDGPATKLTFLADAEGRVVGFLAQPAGAPERRLRKIP
jgi:D-alanyl-D-alanine carboxypeptidase